MPALFHPAGAGVPACLLLLLQADWSTAVKVTYTLESEQSEGLTGIEYRAPKSRSMRLKMTWACLLTESEAEGLRKALAQLGDLRIGVPLWPDAYSAPAQWLHSPQRVISWNATGGYAITPASGSYSYPRAAPLLIGRLAERPTIEPIGQVRWKVKFELNEDSPWDCRIDPAAGYVASSFLWDPEWKNIDDLSKDQLRKVAIGDGRELGMAGGDGTPRWGQEAGVPLYSRGEIADFLRFWYDRQGSVKSFPCPAWCQPGTADSFAPANYISRFDKDLVDITYKTPGVASTKVKLWQEVAVVGDVPQYGAAKTYVYTFTWDQYAPVRVTSWEHALTVGGLVYTPARVGHSQLRKTISSLGDECNFTMFEGDLTNPIRPMVSGEAERRLTVELVQCYVDASGAVVTTAPVFTGDVVSAETKDSTIIGYAKTLGGLFQRKIPRFYIQQGCNYTLCDACCKKSKDSVKATGVLTGTGNSVAIWFHADLTLPSAYANKWFAAGWVEVQAADGTRHRRAILDCFQSGTVFSLHINRPLPSTCEGCTATAYPGCSGDFSMCAGKFSNGANFGGFPFLPAYLSTSSGNGSTPKAK